MRPQHLCGRAEEAIGGRRGENISRGLSLPLSAKAKEAGRNRLLKKSRAEI